MRIVDIIRRKRDGHELSGDEIDFFVGAYTAGGVPDYQAAAWLMAVVLRGMTKAELAALTGSMLKSGSVLDLSSLPGKRVDKHSTGGVGDKTSLVLAPLVAASGLFVPMISGRGLGHTGGTLDKLESIPGFNVNLPVPEFLRVLGACGCGLIGQTREIAPADKKLYALRDVTGTVESPYLICASIMSKKLAEGIDALVLDVKTGSGAFMKHEDEAAYLAQLMVDTGSAMGKKVVALITDMDQPLGRAVGNALEVRECIDVLRGGGPADLRELCLELAAWMLYLGERTPTLVAGKALASELIANGRALEKFREIIRLQSGDPFVVDDPTRLPRAQFQMDVLATWSGYVAQIECEQVGIASVMLGGGREKKEDAIDPAVGLMLHKKVGDAVTAGDSLCTVYYNQAENLDKVCTMLRQAYRVTNAARYVPRLLVHRVIEGTPQPIDAEKAEGAAAKD